MLRHAEFDVAERDAYLRMAKARRGGDEVAEASGNGNGHPDEEVAPATPIISLPEERYAAFAVQEEFILSVTSKGYGKRTSAYEYRIAGRGGQGIANIEMSERNGYVVASFPVRHEDQIMLVTDRGQLIRTPVDDIRIAGRKTQGVTLFKVEEGERVVSVTRLGDENDTEAAPIGNGTPHGEQGD
jgi:DNA gyrase subunit A